MKNLEKYPDCPVGDPSCPYWKDGKCTIPGDPAGQCDDYDYYMGYDEFDPEDYEV